MNTRIKMKAVQTALCLLLLLQGVMSYDDTGSCAQPAPLCCEGQNDDCYRGCYCDEACLERNECCSDYTDTCPKRTPTYPPSTTKPTTTTKPGSTPPPSTTRRYPASPTKPASTPPPSTKTPSTTRRYPATPTKPSSTPPPPPSTTTPSTTLHRCPHRTERPHWIYPQTSQHPQPDQTQNASFKHIYNILEALFSSFLSLFRSLGNPQ